MKKLISLMLCLCMALALCVPAAASGEASAETAQAVDEYAALSLEGASWTLDESVSAWCLTGVTYCLEPVAGKEVMNIFVPAAYMTEDGKLTSAVVNGYNAQTAPIIYVVDMGGYAEANAVSASRVADYLAAGYVVASPSTRGKATTDEDGNFVGKGAASLADLKAGVRFLKYNDDVLAGSAEMIVVTGTSAGGAMSALLGTTGNNAAYDEYLEEIGAIMTEGDDVYACQCYCPITSMEYLDEAYEWYVYGQTEYNGTELTEFQQQLSLDLAALYPDYVNSLGLEDGDGNVLTLDGLREGSYYDYIVALLGESLAAYIEENYSTTVSGMSSYTYIDEEAAQAYIDELNADGEWVSMETTTASVSTGPSTIVEYVSGVSCTVASLDDFVSALYPRGKSCPSTDALDYSGAANQVFGTADTDLVHYSTVIASLLAENDYSGLAGYEEDYAASYAEAYDHEDTVALLNPLNYLQDSDTAAYFRIRVGTADEHAPVTQSLNLALALETYTDATVNYAFAWEQPHGEAEINANDLMDWIERICKFEAEKTDDQIAELLNLDNMEYTWNLSGSGDSAYYVLSPIVEVANPELADYQGLSVAIPAYYVKGVNEDGSLEFDYDYEFENPNGVTYTAATAPIIVNTGAAGYSAGTTSQAGGSYVAYGYINVACGNRGKSLSAVNASGESYYCGDAPYCLVDQKACVRWLKYNIALGNICGDAERIVSTGGSGGGAHSLMLAATGNNPDFYPYLEESGAIMRYTDESGNVIEISDAIWGCCPYSAITNLEEANMAYEFESGLAAGDALLSRYSEFRQILSQGESEEYMAYINALGLTYDIDGDGERETLSIENDSETDTWSGTYIELMEQVAEEQLAWYVNNIPDDEYDWVYSFEGETNGEAYLLGDYASSSASGEASSQTEGYASESDGTAGGTGNDLTDWVTYWFNEDGQIEIDFDIADFMTYRGRSKTNPSFDDLDLGQAENQEFGDVDQDFKHWDIHVLNAMDEYYDELAAAYDGDATLYDSFEELYEAYKADIESTLAGDKYGQNIVYLYNPLNYILDPETELPAWVHIVHGTADTDSSVLISMNDGVAFDMMGVDSYFAWSWDDHHVAGDPVGTTMQGYIDAMVLAGY
ncbi:MAG: hypothetical protein LJU34_07675 [Oscillospiraceae bacterium]|nr:hypothetical protein [Oscillospiraceae bacterium]